MSTLKQFTLFADYNQLMNQRLFSSAAHLPYDELHKDCRVFFKSMIGTLNHIMVGDIIWLKRFSKHLSSQKVLAYISDLEKPKSLDAILFNDLDSLKVEREKIDEIIIQWISSLSETDIEECISYKNMAGISFTQKYSSLISHLFLHQVHHRGQATALLSQYDIDFGETDLIEIINECSTS